MHIAQHKYYCSKLEIKRPREIGLSLSIYIYNGLVGRVFANGPGDRGSIPGRVIPRTLKMVLGTSFLNIQQYKVRTKGRVGQSWERSSAPLLLGVVSIEKGAF